MDSLQDFLKTGDLVVKGLFAKIEKAKEHLTDEQKKTLDAQLKKASKDISTATDLLKDLSNKMND